MKKYVRPMALVNEELAEGVYAASGDCYTVEAKIMQTPQLGRENYVIQIDAVHDATDEHHSTYRRIEIDFNMPVTYVWSGAGSYSGDGSTRLVLDYTNAGGSHHNNAHENIGLGNLTVTAGEGLAIIGAKCTYCDRCMEHH